MEPEQVDLRCANCGRKSRDDENALDEWLAHSDGLGELHVFCAECAAREFGPEDPYQQLRRDLAERLDREPRPLWRRMLGL